MDARSFEASSRQARPGRAWAVRLALALVGLVLPILAVEGCVRAFGPELARHTFVGLDDRRNLSYFEPHPIYGGFHVPNVTAWQWTAEYVTRVDINSRGLREREIPEEKPPGVRRVLMLGDSLVEGAEVAVEEAISRRLEAAINQDGAPPVQVLNAGVLSYGTAQEYLFLQHDGLRYQPDVIVLVFFSGNDVSDNSEALDYPPIRALKPYFELDASGALRAIPFAVPPSPAGPADSLRQRLRRGSLLVSKLDPDALGTVPSDPGYIKTLLAAYAADSSDEWERAWQVTDALLVATRDRAEAAGARFVLVNAPAPWEVDPAYWDWLRGYLGLPATGWDLDRPNRRLAEIAARRGIAYLDLRPALQQALPAHPRLYYQYDGHWTREGHDLAARTLAASGLIPAR